MEGLQIVQSNLILDAMQIENKINAFEPITIEEFDRLELIKKALKYFEDRRKRNIIN